MKKEYIYLVFFSTVWITIINIFFYPIYNTNEDVINLYRLSGSDGFVPTQITHFNHGWHFIIGIIIKNLFILNPKWNWYSTLLLCLNITSSIIIGYELIKKKNKKKGWILYLIYFLLITPNLLLKTNFTSTSLHLALSGMFILYNLKDNTLNKIQIILSIFLLVISGTLRLHMCGLVVVLFIILGFLFYHFKWLIKILPSLIIAFLMLAVLYTIHINYYKNKIINWEQDEELRQSIFNIVNKPTSLQKKAANTNEISDYIKAGIIFDTNYVSVYKIKKYLDESKLRYRNPFNHEYRSSIYWAFKNNLFIMPIFLSLLILFFLNNRYIFKKTLFAIILIIGIYFLFFIFYKVTHDIIFSITIVSTFVFFHQFQELEIDFSRKSINISLFFLMITIFWNCKIIISVNNRNHKQSMLLISQLKELNSYPNNLFIITNESINIGEYPIWQIPSELPMRNILDFYKQLFNNTSEILKRFEIKKDFIENDYSNKKIFIVGNSYNLLKKMYPFINVTEPLTEFKTIEVRRIIKK